MPDIQSEDVTVTGPVAEAGPLTSIEREFTIQARTQREMVVRRFFRHRGAMAGLIVFVFVLVLAYTSIGILGLPGWWPQSYETTGTVQNGGGVGRGPVAPVAPRA